MCSRWDLRCISLLLHIVRTYHDGYSISILQNLDGRAAEARGGQEGPHDFVLRIMHSISGQLKHAAAKEGPLLHRTCAPKILCNLPRAGSRRAGS